MPTRTSGRATGESRSFNLFSLRRLFNKGIGRGEAGTSSRKAGGFHPTISKLAYLALSQAVPVGKGQYGSPVVEMGLRLILCLAGHFSTEMITQELVYGLKDRNRTVTLLRELADKVENFSIE